jgi:O-antigen ligase
MDAAPRPLVAGGVAGPGLVVVVGALLAAAVFAGGGSTDDALPTVGVAAIAAAAFALGLAVRGALALPRLGRTELLAVGACVALTLWAGASIAWSVAGDRSWEWLDRGLVYLAFLALGLLGGASTGGARRVAALTALVLGAAIGWALLGVAIPRFFEDGDRIARLREPVGYWNALAVLADAALAFGLWLARDARALARVGGGLLAYAATVALLLTQSRAGVVGAAVVVALWLLLSDERLADAVRVALFATPGLAVAAWAFTRPALVEDGALRADRVADGRWFAVLAVAGALLAVAAAWVAPVERVVAERERLVRSTIAGLAALAAVVGVVGLVAAVGNPVAWAGDQFSGGECTNAPGRLTDLCANNRVAWWGEALDVAADNPVGGSGAGTFELARRRYRDDATAVSEPHSVPLQLLADTGIVGLALGVLAAGAAALGARRGLRLVGPADRPAVVALACLVAAYAVHALVDYDLDFVAVTAPMLVAAGVLLAAGRERSTRTAGVSDLVALGAVAAAAVLAVALPALADRDVDRALAAADAGRVGEAVDAADRARLLDPLSVGPLDALAVAADAAGNDAAAVAWYEKATKLQPENPDAWYELGLYHAIATGDQCSAYQALNHAYTLDPKSRRWSPGGVLDRARDAVNAGACE